MTVKLENRISRFTGSSTDPKPRPGYAVDGLEITDSDILPGSTFLESDTRRLFIWTGVAWVFADSAEVIELREIKSLLAAVVERMNVPAF